MKKMIAMLMLGILLAVSAAAAAENPAPETIQTMTDLAEIQEKLDQGVTIGKVYYTDGYGFSTSEFTTDDPEEIALLWQAVNSIVVGEKVDESITDWYPQIVFYLTDGTSGGVCFEGKWLCVGGRYNYEISNAEEFRRLTKTLVEKYEEMGYDAVPGGAGSSGAERTVVTAVAAEINPEEPVSVAADAKILTCDGSTCTVILLVPERYRPDEILSLRAGDAIFTRGREVDVHTLSERDGYLVLNAGEENEVCLYESSDLYYRIMEEDDHTWTELATVRVPVSERLLFLDGIDPSTGEALMIPAVHNKADFLAMMESKDDPGFDIRNVMIAFDDRGELALIRRYYVPWQ